MSLIKRSFFAGIGRIFSLPRLSVPLILTLGLTLGAVLSVVAISSSLLYKPLQGVANEAQIKTVSYRLTMNEQMVISYWNFRRLAGIVETFGDLGVWAGISSAEQTISIDNVSYPTTRFNASNTILDVLGTKLLLGDDVKMDDPEKYAWISNSLWQTAYGGAKSVLGKQIKINDKNYIVAGVIDDLMAVASQQPILSQQVWQIINVNKLHKEPEMPNISNEIETLLLKTHNEFTQAPNKDQLDEWLVNFINKNTSAEVAPFYLQFIKKSTITSETGAYRDEILGDTDTLLIALFIAVMGLLFMATLNLLNLFLAHYQGRTKEFAIQLSLGASLFKVRLMVMLENLPSFILAAIAGLLFAGWGIKSLPLIAGNNLPMMETINIDVVVVVIALFTVFLLNVLFSSLALIDINKNALNDNLNSSGKGIQAQSNQYVSRSLMVFQLAIASLLLTASVMLAIQSYQSVYRDLGYTFEDIYQVTATLDDEERLEKLMEHDNYPSSEIYKIHNEISQFIENNVADSNVIIPAEGALSGNLSISMFVPEGDPDNQIMYQSRNLSPEFFDAFNIEFLAGTNLTAEQIAQSEPRMVIDENMAKLLFPDLTLEEIIGKNIKLSNAEEDEPLIINGIVPVTQSQAGSKTTNQIPAAYVANIMANSRLSFVVKMPAGQGISIEDFANEFEGKFPYLSNLDVQSLTSIWQDQTLNQRVSLWVVLTMTSLTLMLAAIGVAGLTQMTTNHRKYELAVRMATGAKQSKLVNFILKDTIWMLVVGLGLGFVLSVFGYEQIKGQLAMLPEFNWWAMYSLDAALVLIVLLSVLIPAWRVIRSDPMQALREE